MADTHAEHDKKAMKAIKDSVEKHGCFIGMFEADNYLPAMAYSIGLFKKFKHPEVICFGMETEVMSNVINHIRDMVKKGTVLMPGKNYDDFLEGYDVQFITVDKDYYPFYLGYAGWFYDNSSDFPALQLVWPDKDRKYPWDEGFDPQLKFKQPLLDRDMDFKFYEERNLSVFTTQEVLDGKPILFASHNEDGDWQFHATVTPDLGDAKIIAFEQITQLHPYINDLYHLPYGWQAWRGNADSEWQFEEEEKG